ncbi:MAG: SUMF1/EgtB/PvdO family nonheme iron enzyme [Anaerolineae bacterium]|nr:SUMF1/EgtB/PvdO family nonheme iron enzyme [Anaerolineae bacterium]
MSHIFISYSHDNHEIASEIASQLTTRGFDVWIDHRRIDFGADWWKTIAQAIRDCSVFVIIMSPESDKSEWVQRELALADALKKPLMPILFDGDILASENFSLLLRVQYVDVRGGKLLPPEFYGRLIEHLRPQQFPGREISIANMSEQHGRRTPIIILEPVRQNANWKPIYGNINGIQMVLVPPGCFRMGSEEGEKDELPIHEYCFKQPFWISKFPITNAQYRTSVDAGACKPPRDRETFRSPERQDHPVVDLSWSQTIEFAKWHQCRLCTEAEWEYTARGPDNLLYPWGNTFNPDYVLFRKNSNGVNMKIDTRPQGQSWVGASDMIGTVWEWTSSSFQSYPYNPSDGRENRVDDERLIVLRGGSFTDDSTRVLRASYRMPQSPNYRAKNTGFRIACDI